MSEQNSEQSKPIALDCALCAAGGYARIDEIKEMMLQHDVSILDINWKCLKQGELRELAVWEQQHHPELGHHNNYSMRSDGYCGA